MDFVKFLGGVALGAAGAALYDALTSPKAMGQTVVTGASGGGGSGGPGIILGPPSGGGSAGEGPYVVNVVSSGEEESATLGPVVSVEHIVQGPGFGGGSFFGISAPPWFWPLNVYPWSYPRRQESLVCRKAELEDGEDVLLCDEVFPVRRFPSKYAWGPSSGWL